MATILAIVNDIFFYTKLRDAVKPQGFQLERARTAQDVSEKLAIVQPEAVILDMNDPALNGLQTLEALRADVRFQTLPVLAFANHDEVETWQRAKRLGVTKIVSRNEFSSRTRDLVTEVLHAVPPGSATPPSRGES